MSATETLQGQLIEVYSIWRRRKTQTFKADPEWTHVEPVVACKTKKEAEMLKEMKYNGIEFEIRSDMVVVLDGVESNHFWRLGSEGSLQTVDVCEYKSFKSLHDQEVRNADVMKRAR
jgi:hypothetical protein